MDIFEGLKGNKVPVNITIDAELERKLRKIMNDKHIKSLSPMINAMLWEWLNKQEENKS
jgi:hypothetical protein